MKYYYFRFTTPKDKAGIEAIHKNNSIISSGMRIVYPIKPDLSKFSYVIIQSDYENAEKLKSILPNAELSNESELKNAYDNLDFTSEGNLGIILGAPIS